MGCLTLRNAMVRRDAPISGLSSGDGSISLHHLRDIALMLMPVLFGVRRSHRRLGLAQKLMDQAAASMVEAFDVRVNGIEIV